MFKIKMDGKYIKSAREVAEYFGITTHAVYESRGKKVKRPNKFDKLMTFEQLKEIADREDSCPNPVVGSFTCKGIKYSIVENNE